MQEDTPSSGETTTPADAPEDAQPATDELAAAVADAEARAAASRDQFLRAAAELENFRKRAARDVENARKFGLEAFAAELLQVRDSLELGLAAADNQEATVESLREGTGMTLRLLEQVMEKFGIVAIEAHGQPFDPELHEAMVMVESDAAPNTVVEVVQKGYQLNERLLRPARVVVARQPDEESRDTA